MVKEEKLLSILGIVVILLLIFPSIAAQIPLAPTSFFLPKNYAGYIGHVQLGKFSHLTTFIYPQSPYFLFLKRPYLRSITLTLFGLEVPDICATSYQFLESKWGHAHVLDCKAYATMQVFNIWCCPAYGPCYICDWTWSGSGLNFKGFNFKAGWPIKIERERDLTVSFFPSLNWSITSSYVYNTYSSYTGILLQDLTEISVIASKYQSGNLSVRTIPVEAPENPKLILVGSKGKNLTIDLPSKLTKILTFHIPPAFLEEQEYFEIFFNSSNQKPITISLESIWVDQLASVKFISSQPLKIEVYDHYSGEKLGSAEGTDLLIPSSEKVDIRMSRDKFRSTLYGVNLTSAPIKIDITVKDEYNQRKFEINISEKYERGDFELSYAGLPYRNEKNLFLQKCERGVCREIPAIQDFSRKSFIVSSTGASTFVIREKQQPIWLYILLVLLIIIVVIILFAIIRKKPLIKRKKEKTKNE